MDLEALSELIEREAHRKRLVRESLRWEFKMEDFEKSGGKEKRERDPRQLEAQRTTKKVKKMESRDKALDLNQRVDSCDNDESE